MKFMNIFFRKNIKLCLDFALIQIFSFKFSSSKIKFKFLFKVKDRKLTGARCGGLIPPKIKDTSSGEGFSLGTAIRLLFSPLWLIIVTVYIFGHLLNFYGAGNVEHLARMHLPGTNSKFFISPNKDLIY